MTHLPLKRWLYHVRHHYLTVNNAVIMAAGIVALGWVWGSLSVMQRNYTLQRTLDRKQQELQVAELQTRNLELEANYYKTREYQELAVRERLGKGNPGEKVLLLPVSTTTPASAAVAPASTSGASSEDTPSNLQQWLDFLFGTNRARLQ